MPYCGRPSTACHACRVKRGKCDRKKPGCGQCARKRTPCPGYPDPLAVVFRDQTLATTRKVQRKSDLPPDMAPYSMPVALALPKSLPVATEDVATTFFLTSYAPTSPTGYLSDLADGLLNDGLSSSAVLAPALATLSRELVQPSLMALARKHYSVAIQQTNTALASRELAVKDETLASVLLLALFEASAFQGRRSPTGWTMHVDGAAQLLKMRGPSQFDSPLGRSMFLDIVSDIFISCAQRRVAVPRALTELLAQLGDVVGHDDLGVGMARVTADMADLVALVALLAAGGDRLASVAVQVVRRGRQLDADLDRMLERYREIRPYTVIDPASAPESAYNGLAHHYSSHKLCWQWNNLRMMRLFANRSIVRVAAAAATGSPLQDSPEAVDVLQQPRLLEMAASTAERMAADILATVAYCNSLPAASNARLATARWLIWPLSVVATSTVAPLSARIYARDTLYALGRDSGISQAAEAGKMVDETNNQLEDWCVIETNICILRMTTRSLI
ncbi:hypothetical protein C8A01DRAFT_20356 [Parachaetomium inaequale]|uniref:Zn(2)-C6 fungal-type domain-containing protein n=1 Tax=Parachaetomium inaequale TaxID=2588326 RepID=A0AAN6P913_9PEZI|nr:hypothetical protein C8A01DRAFT_20356 [Parachaetomium inaequale]